MLFLTFFLLLNIRVDLGLRSMHQFQLRDVQFGEFPFTSSVLNPWLDCDILSLFPLQPTTSLPPLPSQDQASHLFATFEHILVRDRDRNALASHPGEGGLEPPRCSALGWVLNHFCLNYFSLNRMSSKPLLPEPYVLRKGQVDKSL